MITIMKLKSDTDNNKIIPITGLENVHIGHNHYFIKEKTCIFAWTILRFGNIVSVVPSLLNA